MLKLEASLKDIIKITIFFGILYFLWKILSIVSLVFIAVIITSSLNPIIDFFEAKRIPRPATIVFILLVSVFLIYLSFSFILPTLNNEISNFADTIPTSIDEVAKEINKKGNFLNPTELTNFTKDLEGQIQNGLKNATGDILKFGFGVIDGIFSLLTLAVVTFYLLLDHGTIKDFFLSFSSGSDRVKTSKIWDIVEHKLGVWLRGQLVVMVLIGVITYIGLRLLHVDLALPLALVAGIFEIVPILGPLISAIPAIIIAVAMPNQDPVLQFFTVTIFYFIVQQLEAIFVVPKVMNQAVGLNPLVIILAVAAGSKLGGPIGALLSVPIAVLLYIALDEWQKSQNHETTKTISQPSSK
jgi:predicted PurR-regulated permease PerM